MHWMASPCPRPKPWSESYLRWTCRKSTPMRYGCNTRTEALSRLAGIARITAEKKTPSFKRSVHTFWERGWKSHFHQPTVMPTSLSDRMRIESPFWLLKSFMTTRTLWAPCWPSCMNFTPKGVSFACLGWLLPIEVKIRSLRNTELVYSPTKDSQANWWKQRKNLMSLPQSSL